MRASTAGSSASGMKASSASPPPPMPSGRRLPTSTVSTWIGNEPDWRSRQKESAPLRTTRKAESPVSCEMRARKGAHCWRSPKCEAAASPSS